MKKLFYLSILATCGLLIADDEEVPTTTPAVPSISDVTITTQADSPCLTISYMLSGANAIITPDVQTNAGTSAEGPWVSIGDANIGRFSGEVNQWVTTNDSPHIIRWSPHSATLQQAYQAGELRVVVNAWTADNPPDYAVVDLILDNCWRYYTSVEALPEGGLSNPIYQHSKLVLRRIPAKGVTFTMGSPPTEAGRVADEMKPHSVTLTSDFYLGIYTITSAQQAFLNGWMVSPDCYAFHPAGKRVMQSSDSGYLLSWTRIRGNAGWPNTEDPVAAHNVTANSLLGKLRTKSGGALFDLPTEAQWEFACRAGTTTARYDMVSPVNQLGWYGLDTPNENLHPVGLLKPNAWGLYDMYGNSWEYCLDWFQSNPSDGSAETDPVGPATGTKRVVKGGAYNSAAVHLRSAYRNSGFPDTILIRYAARVCLPIPNK